MAGDLLGAALPPANQEREPTEWSIDEVSRCKQEFDRLMRDGNNADSPDEWGSYLPLCPAWEWKALYQSQYNAVMNWALGIPCRCLGHPVDPARGLWFVGNSGTGKSTLMKCLKIFCSLYADSRSPNMPRQMLWRHAKDIADEYEKTGAAALDKYVSVPTLIIDDLGTEDQESRHYGNSKNPVEDILSRRYDKGNDRMTMVTTNLDMKQVEKFYHGRVRDRVREMFNFIEFMGSTHRKNFNPNV